MNAEAVKNGLNSIEKIKKIHLSDVVFTPENNLLTPTMKIKRNSASEFFDKQIA